MNNNWIKKAIIYHVFIDRFAGFNEAADDTQPGWVGGNIRGIIKKLPYLIDLGINCLWISPFCKNSAYHGYHITDFYEVDEHFGTKDDLKELVDKCHAAGIKIIFGFVPNHCSSQHPFFLDAQKNKDSQYKDWFYFTKWPNDYLCFLQYKELPKLNLDNDETRKYIIDNAIYWLEEFGFDGMRLDHAIGPSHEFWQEFTKRVEHKKDFILIGEVTLSGVKVRDFKTIRMEGLWPSYVLDKLLGVPMRETAMQSYVDVLDGCMDFRFLKLLKDFIVKGQINESAFKKRVAEHYSKYPKDFLLPVFLDNHDINRFLFEVKNNKEQLMQAIRIQFSVNQPKIIYYGDEIGMTHEDSIDGVPVHDDLETRKRMIWDENKQDRELHDFYKKVIHKTKQGV